RLRRVEVVLFLVALAVAVRVVPQLPVPAPEPRLAVEDEALHSHPTREGGHVAGLVGRQQELHERIAVLHRGGVPVDRAARGVQARLVLAPHLAAVLAPVDAGSVSLEPRAPRLRAGGELAAVAFRGRDLLNRLDAAAWPLCRR